MNAMTSCCVTSWLTRRRTWCRRRMWQKQAAEVLEISFRIVNNILPLSVQLIFGLNVLANLENVCRECGNSFFVKLQLMFVCLYCSGYFLFCLSFSLFTCYHLWWIKMYTDVTETFPNSGVLYMYCIICMYCICTCICTCTWIEHADVSFCYCFFPLFLMY